MTARDSSFNPLYDFLYQLEEDVSGLEAQTSPRDEVLPPREEAPIELLLFRLGERHCALPLLTVQEVVRPTTLTELPRGPANVLGVMGLRGDVLPVFDPKRRVGLAQDGRTRAGPDAQSPLLPERILVVADPQGIAGLWVDSVLGVARVLPSMLKRPLDPPPPPWVAFSVEIDARAIDILDVSLVLE